MMIADEILLFSIYLAVSPYPLTMKQNDNLVLGLTFEFALAIVKYCELLEEKKKYVIARQLLRAGTSIGANAREAQNCESRNDFVHKFKLAAKEAEETEYWLLICQASSGYPSAEEMIEKIVSIKKVINKIIASTIKNRKTETPSKNSGTPSH